jgi:hypothetical protein
MATRDDIKSDLSAARDDLNDAIIRVQSAANAIPAGKGYVTKDAAQLAMQEVAGAVKRLDLALGYVDELDDGSEDA